MKRQDSNLVARIVGALWVAAMLLICGPAYAYQGSLDDWFHNDVTPAFSELVNDAPRFLGEAISIVALDNGQVVPIRDELTRRLHDDLRHMLLTRTNARIPVSTGSDSCGVPTSHIVLGIEVTRHSDSQHRVHLAFLDLDDNLWVNGSSRTWVGQLSRQASELYRRADAVTQSTLKADDVDTIATTIVSQLGCHQFASPLFVEDVTTPLGKAFQQALKTRYTVTNDTTLARTRLRIVQTEHTVALRFADQRSAVDLASVALIPDTPRTPLLTEITVSNTEKDCRGHGRRCVDIEYEVLDDAFVFEFYSRDGRLVNLACEDRPARQHGLTRKGLKVPEATDMSRPVLGFYVLASRDAGIAHQLKALLTGNGASCSSTPDATRLGGLAELVASHQVTWRTIHFQDQYGGIRTL